MLIPSVCSNEEQLDYSQDNFDGDGYPINYTSDGIWGCAQSFKPSVETLTRAEVYLRKVGDVSFNLSIELRESSPDGPILDEATFTPENISSSWEWLEIDFNDTNVSISQDYFIVIVPDSSNPVNSFPYEWGYANSDVNPNSSFYNTSDGGLTWNLNNSFDLCMKTYGYTKDTIEDIGYTIGNTSEGIFGCAQSFKPTWEILDYAEVYLRKVGNVSFNLSVELRQSMPNGSLIEKINFTPDEINEVYTWLEIDFEDIHLSNEEEYFILLLPISNDSNDSCYYEWVYAQGDEYSNSSFYNTANGGMNWSINTSIDLRMRIYEYNEELETTELSLSFINLISYNKVNANVKNIGTVEAFNVSLSLFVEYGFLSHENDSSINIDRLSADETSEALEIENIRGFGFITVTAEASADNAPHVETSVSGWIIGRFVLLLGYSI